jgi:hypothetical protein
MAYSYAPSGNRDYLRRAIVALNSHFLGLAEERVYTIIAMEMMPGTLARGEMAKKASSMC